MQEQPNRRWLVCSECSGVFSQFVVRGRKRYTCSSACTSQRIRRLDRERFQRKTGAHPKGRTGRDPCEVAGCTRLFYAKGLCSMHYNRLRQKGHVGPPGQIRIQGKFRWADKSGYVYLEPTITGRTKRILEHRFVMEEAIGRRLGRQETVHHINGDRGDNRLENLQLMRGKHAAGQAARCADCGSAHVVYVGIGDAQESLV